MLLGPPMPAPFAAWRFVEGDLHDTAKRVREYDDDARLVRHATGRLALAVWVKQTPYTIGGRWTMAAELRDPQTGAPLAGEPDARVLTCQRAFDGWHHARTRQSAYEYRRRVQDKRWRDEANEHKQIEDGEGENAERFVHALRKDVSSKPRAFVPRAV